MSESVQWAYEEDSVAELAEFMSEHQIRRMPTVNADKRFVGVVAPGDFAVDTLDTADIAAASEAPTEIS